MATRHGFRAVRYPDPAFQTGIVAPYSTFWEEGSPLVTAPSTSVADSGGFFVMPDYRPAAKYIGWAGTWFSGVTLCQVRLLLVTYDTADIIATTYAYPSPDGTHRAQGGSSLYKTQPSSPGGIWASSGRTDWPWLATDDNTAHRVTAADIGVELSFADAVSLSLRNDVDAILAGF